MGYALIIVGVGVNHSFCSGIVPFIQPPVNSVMTFQVLTEIKRIQTVNNLMQKHDVCK